MRQRLATITLALMALLLGCSLVSAQEPETNYLPRLKQLGLSTLNGKVPAFYSAGHREHAQKLQAAIEDMNAFYRSQLGVQMDVRLALLNAEDWKKVLGEEYGFPAAGGDPEIIFMPATSDNPVYGLVNARKAAIPAAQLQEFLKAHHTTFPPVEADFVDLVGFHELGHRLTSRFGIDPQDRWLNEFVASYWSYLYVWKRQPAWKSVMALLGRPSSVRPKNTSLDDFERLYDNVDDYGWYQGMFESRIQEIVSTLGVKFLSDLRKRFPLQPGKSWEAKPLDVRMKPAALLEQLEQIAPGFQKWAEGFDSAP